MADFAPGADGAMASDSSRGGRMGALAAWSGGLVSLVLVAGLAWWGYELAMRDVTGVPVVKALDGPIRIAPEDPGGATAAHQGLAVNEIPAVGTAGGPAPEVTLAPAPAPLSEEDRPRAEIAPADAEPEGAAGLEEAEPELASGEDAVTEDALEAAVADGEAPVDKAMEDALAIDRAVAEALGGLAAGAAGFEEGATPGVAEEDEDGISRSPRPARRPDAIGAARAVAITASTAALPAASPAVSSAADAERVEPQALRPGTRLVQLGAYPTEEMALQEWRRIGARFGEHFEGKRRVLQSAQSGGRTFYRLRAEGFEDLADAQGFCSTLLAERAECIPVELR